MKKVVVDSAAKPGVRGLVPKFSIDLAFSAACPTDKRCGISYLYIRKRWR